MTRPAEQFTPIQNNWLEQCAADASLRTFVDAEIARAYVELQALRVENAHLRQALDELRRKLQAMAEFLSAKRR